MLLGRFVAHAWSLTDQISISQVSKSTMQVKVAVADQCAVLWSLKVVTHVGRSLQSSVKNDTDEKVFQADTVDIQRQRYLGMSPRH